MRDIENLCVNCFEALTQGCVCGECGYDNDTQNPAMYLPAKTVLAGKYVVGAFIKHESDAVTYMGYDAQLDKKIYIREFMPKGLANRLDGAKEMHIRPRFIESVSAYKNEFYKLWTTMEKLHALSAAVPVYDVFDENATTYAVIEHIDAIPMREYLLRNEEGFIPWETARLMFMPVLTTIENLHANGIVHGSITPDSLMLCRDGKVRLEAFCIGSCCDVSTNLEFIVNDGYTALEQYENNHKICPATDIYAFTACIYRALVGTNPPAAPSREVNDKLMIPNSIAETIPMHVIKAMGNGLQIYPEKRIKEVSYFRELLDAAPAVKAKAAMVEHVEEKVQPPVRKRKAEKDVELKADSNKKSKIIIGVLVVLIIAALAAGIYIVKFTDLIPNSQDNTQPSAASATYEVPNFTSNGYTMSDIQNNGVWNEQFKITFESDYSTDVEEGLVFKQSVAPGETVNAGTQIVLTVSKGIQTQEVLDVGGLTLEEATKKLEAVGFKVSSVEVYNDGSHTPNTVKSSYGSAPAAGEVVAVGDEIVLQVYGEEQTTTQPTEPTTEDEPTTENPVRME